MFRGLFSVMYFVADVSEATRWYSRLLSMNPIYILPDFPIFNIDGVELCFHRADAKGTPFIGGSVVYWRVDHFERTRQRCEHLGAVLHRGPLEIEGSQQIGQFRDPFGNVFGIVAPAASATEQP